MSAGFCLDFFVPLIRSPSAATDLPLSTREELIHALDRWAFEPHKLPDEHAIACTVILFQGLFAIKGMREAVGVPFGESHSSSENILVVARSTHSIPYLPSFYPSHTQYA